ncbi:MAG TPA: lysophospholipid acyltransferase family protein [Actinomycetes bacterium]|nr:lysophospholipid acyltransferase family protein [Actinomycetes bacterium]
MRGEESPGAAYSFARTVLRPVMRLTTHRQWQGLEHLPPDGGCVVVANHVSHSDPIPVGDFIDAAGRRPRYLGKAELFDVPVLGPFLHSAGQIPVQRETAQAGAALAAAVDAVRQGHCVVIYPEGTLTRDPDLWPMVGKTGAARVWWQTRCPVVPVGQWGAHELLAPYGRVPHLWPRPVMRVKAGPPLDLSVSSPPDFQALTAAIMAAITALVGDLRGLAPPIAAFDPHGSDLPRTGNPARRDEGSH